MGGPDVTKYVYRVLCKEWDQHNAAGEGEQDAAGGEGSLGAPA